MKKKVSFVLGVTLLSGMILSGCNKTNKDAVFTVYWKNYDETVLERDVGVKYGEMPTYDGKTPARKNDTNSYYIFKGWDKEITEAKSDVTYTAVYDSYSLDSLQESPDGYVDNLSLETSKGNIFHAFCWTFNDIKDKMSDIANAGFKSVQISPVQQPKSSGSSWWAFYQPLSFSIADNSKLGTKEELKEMCDVAESYGISVIADIVFNHMANIKDGELENDGTPKVLPGVAAYEPYIYEHRNDAVNPTFHHNPSGGITQYYPYGDLPDLNTGNEYVQERCLSLLKECIDVGIDGFRFDAAKHIETPDDPEYASYFWPNTLGVAKTYYKAKTGKDLFAYGEILNGVDGKDRQMSFYTKYMAVTDNAFGGALYNNLTGNASAGTSDNYKGVPASDVVNWVESHDTFCESKNHHDNDLIMRGYAMVATRKESRALYLSRTDGSYTVGQIYDYIFESNVLGAINRFHNRFYSASEKMYAEKSVFVNVRDTGSEKGAVIVDLKPTSSYIAVKLDGLGNDVYYDQITGTKYEVRNSYLTLKMPSSGVVILTKSNNVERPILEMSSRGEMFVNDLEVTMNAVVGSGSYTVNGGQAAAFTGEKKISLASLVDADGVAILKVTVTNGDFSINRTFKYQKVKLIDGYFNIVNVKPEYFTDYELYMWSWKPNEGGVWNKNYLVQDGIVLVDTTGFQGFLLAVFPKGYVVTNVNEWDNNCVSQTVDITGDLLASGFFDGSNF